MAQKHRPPRYKPYSYQDLVHSMYQGLKQAYEKIISDKPDLVIIPLRGSEPLLRGIQAMANVDGSSQKIPPYLFLELGESIGKPSQVDWIEANRETIERKLGPAVRKLNKEDPDIMILDETQHGTVFHKNYLQIKKFLSINFPQARLRAIAISDVIKSGQKIPFAQLDGEDITVIGVKRLISMDQPDRLPKLQWDDGQDRIAHFPSESDDVLTRLSLIEDIQRHHAFERRHEKNNSKKK